MKPGFYKFHDDTETLVRAGKFVYGPGFELIADDKDTYDLPIDGWYWFEDLPDALKFFALPDDVDFIE